MNSTQPAQVSYRIAQRGFHCHECNTDFRAMVNLSDPNFEVKCSNCNSDFIEEQASAPRVQVNQQPQPQPQQPQAQQIPQQQRPQPQPQVHVHQQHAGIPGGFQMHQQQQMPAGGQQTTYTRSFHPQRGWTQSVTVSYGPNGSVTQTASSGGASAAAHQQQNQQPQQNQQYQYQRQEFPMFGGDPFQGGQDPFQSMFSGMEDLFSQGFGGNLNGMMQGMRMGGHGGPVFFFNGGMPQQQRPRSAGLSQDLLNSLPSKPKDVECDCFVCLDKVSNETENVYLPCKHSFCKKCIEPWFKDHDTCPACRVKIKAEDARAQAQEMAQEQQEQSRQSESNATL